MFETTTSLSKISSEASLFRRNFMDTPNYVLSSTGASESVAPDLSAITRDTAQAMQMSIVGTASDVASSSVDMALSKAGQFAQSEQVQSFIKEQGLEPYLKDVTKDRVKNILSLFGLWYITKLFKSKYAIVGAGALAVYVVYQNKDKLLDKVATQVVAPKA
jgi:hypothetical protein